MRLASSSGAEVDARQVQRPVEHLGFDYTSKRSFCFKDFVRDASSSAAEVDARQPQKHVEHSWTQPKKMKNMVKFEITSFLYGICAPCVEFGGRS